MYDWRRRRSNPQGGEAGIALILSSTNETLPIRTASTAALISLSVGNQKSYVFDACRAYGSHGFAHILVSGPAACVDVALLLPATAQRFSHSRGQTVPLRPRPPN